MPSRRIWALQYRVENAEIAQYPRRSRNPLPAGAIIGWVGIHQTFPKPFFAFTPINQQMLDKERRRNHAHAVMHIACAGNSRMPASTIG